MVLTRFGVVVCRDEWVGVYVAANFTLSVP